MSYCCQLGSRCCNEEAHFYQQGGDREAGLTVRLEPDTHGLLLGELSKSDCGRVFPKQYASKDYRDKFDAFIAATELVASPACVLSVEDKRALVQSKIDALPSVRREDTKGLRIDVALENETTGVSAHVSDAILIPDPFKLDPSPTLIDRCAAKISKYSRLVAVARKQAVEKKRRQAPRFMAIAVSDYGELAPMAADLCEWLVQQFRLKCEQEGKRADGVGPLERVRDFRRKLYTRIQFAVAAGCGEMMLRAGQAWG